MKLDVFSKIALTIVVICSILLGAYFLWGCETRIGKVEWLNHPSGAISDLDRLHAFYKIVIYANLFPNE